jgi:hypothetical protein
MGGAKPEPVQGIYSRPYFKLTRYSKFDLTWQKALFRSGHTHMLGSFRYRGSRSVSDDAAEYFRNHLRNPVFRAQP